MSQNCRAVKLETFLISSIMAFLLSHEASHIDLEKQLLFPSVIAADWLQLGWLQTEPNDRGCSITKSLLLCLYLSLNTQSLVVEGQKAWVKEMPNTKYPS